MRREAGYLGLVAASDDPASRALASGDVGAPGADTPGAGSADGATWVGGGAGAPYAACTVPRSSLEPSLPHPARATSPAATAARDRGPIADDGTGVRSRIVRQNGQDVSSERTWRRQAEQRTSMPASYPRRSSRRGARPQFYLRVGVTARRRRRAP